jgi:hypothetical protein
MTDAFQIPDNNFWIVLGFVILVFIAVAIGVWVYEHVWSSQKQGTQKRGR